MLDRILSFIADSLTRKADVLEASTYMLDRAPVRKRCGIVTLYMTALKSLPQGSDKKIAQLPAGYEPAVNLQKDFATPTGQVVRISVDVDGSIRAYNYSTTTGTLNLRILFTYVAGGGYNKRSICSAFSHRKAVAVC